MLPACYTRNPSFRVRSDLAYQGIVFCMRLYCLCRSSRHVHVHHPLSISVSDFDEEDMCPLCFARTARRDELFRRRDQAGRPEASRNEVSMWIFELPGIVLTQMRLA